MLIPLTQRRLCAIVLGWGSASLSVGHRAWRHHENNSRIVIDVLLRARKDRKEFDGIERFGALIRSQEKPA